MPVNSATRATFLCLCLLGGALPPARARETVTGTWHGTPVSLAAGVDDWSGEVRRGSERWRLTLFEQESRWRLRTERWAEVAATPGLSGAVAGQGGGRAWAWGRPAFQPLSRRGDRLVGPETDLAAPSSGRGPSPTDVGWFEDAEELEVPPEARATLERALESGSDDDARALGPIDTNLATPVEKARLVEHVLDGDTTDDDRAWIRGLFDGLRDDGTSPLPIRRHARGEGARTLEALRDRGRLEHLADDGDPAVYRSLLPHVRNADLAADLVVALAGDGGDERVLAAHWVLDRARARGELGRVLDLVRERGAGRDGVERVLAHAAPTRRPVIYGHRGDPLSRAENTLAAVQAARRSGATGVEIDLCLTRDGQVVLWHDADPDGMVALVRQLGLEGGVAWRPTVPAAGTTARRPVHALTLAELRVTHGYVPRGGGPSRAGLSTLAEVAPALRAFERVLLDVKVPADRPDLFAPFARALRRTLALHGLSGRSIVMSPEGALVRGLKPHLPGLAFTHDVEITRVLAGGDHSAVATALAMGNGVSSVGRPRVPKLGGEYTYYLDVLRRDRARIEREGLSLELVAWTIDDELELREVMAIGVDGVVTNQVALAAAVVRVLFPR